MFNFVFEGKSRPTAAQEDMVVATADDVNGKSAPESCSDGAMTIMKSGAVRGIVNGFAMRMAAKGVPAEEITERITAFINSAAIAGDLDKGAANWIKDSDWYHRLERKSIMTVSISDCMWTYVSDLVECAQGDCSYAADCSRAARAAMTEEERLILDNYDKCRKAFYEAECIRANYYLNRAKRVIRDLLVKYAEILGKLDPELFDYMCRVYEINTGNSASESVPPQAL